MLEEKKPSKTALEDLGEFALIEQLTKSATTAQSSTIHGVRR
jgi:hypothetical protein